MKDLLTVRAHLFFGALKRLRERPIGREFKGADLPDQLIGKGGAVDGDPAHVEGKQFVPVVRNFPEKRFEPPPRGHRIAGVILQRFERRLPGRRCIVLHAWTAVRKEQIDQQGRVGVVGTVKQRFKIFLHLNRCLDVVDPIPESGQGAVRSKRPLQIGFPCQGPFFVLVDAFPKEAILAIPEIGDIAVAFQPAVDAAHFLVAIRGRE